MAQDIDELLGAFSESKLTVKLVNGICHAVPFAPPHPMWFSLVEGLTELDPDAKKPVLDAARKITQDEAFQRAVWMLGSVDTADTGISVFSGVRSAIKMAQAANNAERLDALETDTQQAVDAVLKGLVLAFVIHKLFEGSVLDKVEAFRKTQTGQAIIFTYATLEIALPFADNALLGGGAFVKGLFDKHARGQLEKLAAVTGEQEAQEAMGLMQRLIGPVETMVGMAAGHVGPVADAAAGALGKALDVGDKVAGVAATSADLLPVYRYLGARLVAEVALRRALDAREEEAASASSNPANVEIKYTRSANDLPAPPPRRKGCFGLWLALMSAGVGSGLWATQGLWS